MPRLAFEITWSFKPCKGWAMGNENYFLSNLTKSVKELASTLSSQTRHRKLSGKIPLKFKCNIYFHIPGAGGGGKQTNKQKLDQIFLSQKTGAPSECTFTNE